jgi:hypothetical protein
VTQVDTALKVAHYRTADLACTCVQWHTISWGGMVPKKRMARQPSHASTHILPLLALLHQASGFPLSNLHAHWSLHLLHSNCVQPWKAGLQGCEGQHASCGLQSQRQHQNTRSAMPLLSECLSTDFLSFPLSGPQGTHACGPILPPYCKRLPSLPMPTLCTYLRCSRVPALIYPF